MYSGRVCREELTSLQQCYSGFSPSPLIIPSAINQQDTENDASSLLTEGLPLLNPSQECMDIIRPLICLHLFGLCDTNNDLREPVMETCLDVRDNICTREWSVALMFLGPGVLPVCEELPDQRDECIGKNLINSRSYYFPND